MRCGRKPRRTPIDFFGWTLLSPTRPPWTRLGTSQRRSATTLSSGPHWESVNCKLPFVVDGYVRKIVVLGLRAINY